ncbi:hypothetical protein [Aestuariivirga sp.]|uniref:hypothetical protein n=1 Tax=Aestuariivirga sp. TaxID=2650926 RepID=UPI00391DAB2E
MNSDPLSPELALRVAVEGALYLARSLDAQGRFQYWRPASNLPSIPDVYESNRHFLAATALYDMGKLVQSSQLLEAGHRALSYGVATFVKPFQDVACVISSREIVLGGAGLAISAMAAAPDHPDAEQHKQIAQSLGKYILSQARGDGDFVHVRGYPISAEMPVTSRLFSWQALLGLVSLSQFVAQPSWGEFAASSAKLLSRSKPAPNLHSYYALYLISRLPGLLDDPSVHKLSDGIIRDLLKPTGGDGPVPGRKWLVTTLACGCEGLLAWLRGTNDGGDVGRRAVERRVESNLISLLKLRNGDGSFVSDPGRTDVRIDYVQHSVFAFAAYYMFRLATDQSDASAATQNKRGP